MPGVYTTGIYDTTLWEPVDMIVVSHNESISALRDFGVGIGQIFGGKSELLEKNFSCHSKRFSGFDFQIGFR